MSYRFQKSRSECTLACPQYPCSSHLSVYIYYSLVVLCLATEEIWTEMEDEYLNITSGRDIIAWLQKWKSQRFLISEILETYGLSIHRYNMEREDCQLVAETLAECSTLKILSFSYSKGPEALLDVLRKAKSVPKVRTVLTQV